MLSLVLDIETNGLLREPNLKMLCVVAKVLETGEIHRFHLHGHPDAALATERLRRLLSRTDVLIGHNLSGFDIHVLERHYGPSWKWSFRLYDTIAISRLRFIGDISESVFAFRNSFRSDAEKEAAYPAELLHREKMHNLAAWGYRLGMQKGDYLKSQGVQESWSQELEDYCLQDVLVTERLFEHLQQEHRGRPAPSRELAYNESMYTYLLGLQELGGVFFDEAGAAALYARLCGRRDALTLELKALFPAWYRPSLTKGDPPPADLVLSPGDAAIKIPKVTYKVAPGHTLAGRAVGCAYTPVEKIEFNPASRQMIADRLIALYGWVPDPTKLTLGGEIQVDETTLLDLPYPVIPTLIEYLITEKLCAQVADGKQAWLKYSKNGKLHGRVQSTGARTTRCAHSKPNLAQVPKVHIHPETRKPIEGYAGHYGAECRGLFSARPGWVMVGADAAGLELRMLASRLGRYDEGAFGRLLLEGDVHAVWQKACGTFFRDNQKTLTYAFLYGAGNRKLGMTVLHDRRQAREAGMNSGKIQSLRQSAMLGGEARARLITAVPGLATLLQNCSVAFRRGWVTLVDGTIVVCKSEHGTLNDVLQGDGARVMKRAKVLLADRLSREGLEYGRDFEWLLDIHDEWQIGCPPSISDFMGAAMVQAIRDSGSVLGLRVALDGSFKVGNSWKETH